MAWSIAFSLFVLLAVNNQINALVLEDYVDCAGNGNLVEIRVEPCDEEPCIFRRGDKASVEVDFVSDVDHASTDDVKLSIRAHIGGAWIPFPGLKTDACDGMGITCPIKKGQRYTFKTDIKILQFYPSLTTESTWRLKAGDYDLFCFQTEVVLE